MIIINKYHFNFLKIDKRNNLTNIYTKQYLNMAAMYRRRRHPELNSQASTQGCNTLRLTYPHSHRGLNTGETHPVFKANKTSEFDPFYGCIQTINEGR